MRHIEVVAAIIQKDDKIFATQRGYGEWKDWWEFPGGKMEPGEMPEEALVREIREELDTEISVDKFLHTVDWDYPKFHLTMHCFMCSLKTEALHLNEHEAAGLARKPVETAPEELIATLSAAYPKAMICVTLGEAGSLLWTASTGVIRQKAYPVKAVDTTAAGDTFTGYFLAELTRGASLEAALDMASRASAIAVTRPGALDSIPYLKELKA